MSEMVRVPLAELFQSEENPCRGGTSSTELLSLLAVNKLQAAQMVACRFGSFACVNAHTCNRPLIACKSIAACCIYYHSVVVWYVDECRASAAIMDKALK